MYNEAHYKYLPSEDKPFWSHILLSKTLLTPSNKASEIPHSIKAPNHSLKFASYKNSLSIIPLPVLARRINLSDQSKRPPLKSTKNNLKLGTSTQFSHKKFIHCKQG